MIIHNATFIGRRELEKEILEWLKIHSHGIEDETGKNPRISVMREAGGVRAAETDTASIAYQIEFPDEETAKAWNISVFESLALKFTERFGGDNMVFTSLFEVV